MEGKKFNIVMDTDENGKLVRKIVPCDQGQTAPVYAVFGDYVLTDKDRIQEAKNKLLDDLCNAIREIAKHDDFWIVKTFDEDTISIGWKFHIPQMDKR